MQSFQAIGSTIIEFDNIDSTNSYAMDLANKSMAEHGTVVMALHQTKGRGQQGKVWDSEHAKNLLISIVLDMSKQNIPSQFLLNAAFCSALTHELMEHYQLQATSVKWPNDIYVHKKKIAGILIENVIRGQQWQYAIVGIGINVNQKVFNKGFWATSLSVETKKEFLLHDIRKSVLKACNVAFENYLNRRPNIIEEYNSLLYGIGQKISFYHEEEKKSGVLYGASEYGFLRIDNMEYRHGEIQILL